YGTARIWDVQSGAGSIIYAGSGNFPLTAEFSPDGRQAALAGFDESIIVLEVEKNIVLGRVRREGHRACRAMFSPDGSDLLTLFSDGKILVFGAQGNFFAPRRSIDAPDSYSLDSG